MTSEILWQHDCPGHIVTEEIDGEIWISCYLGVEPPGPPRVSEGLQVLYTFGEGSGTTIHDVAGVGPSLDLTLESETAVSWIAGGGLSIVSPTRLTSTGPAQKVIDGARASNEITLEAWVKPENQDYDGPARIITLSSDVHHRHFQLAQAAELYDVRLRTTQTTANGRPSLATPPGVLKPELTHIVFTREAAGMARIYVNGCLLYTSDAADDN